MRRRGHNEGTLYQRPDGLWVAMVDLGYEDTKRRRKAFYAKTRREANDKLAQALKARKEGLPLSRERQTVQQYLNSWLDSAKPRLRPRTWERYEEIVRLHALPSLGRLPLARLTPQHLQALYADRLRSGQSPASVQRLHQVLGVALSQAERFGLVPRNIVRLVDPPRVPRREMSTLTPEQARAFLDAARGDRLEALYTLALATGMRQGELLALRWRDVDLDAGRLRVVATLQPTGKGYVFAEPKTARSRRSILLGQAAVVALRRHRVRQAEERIAAGPSWDDQDLVFSNTIGRPLDASNVSKLFHGLLAQVGLPRIRFHDLRHTAATLMLGRGVPLKVVSDALGHSQIAVTADTYMHVTPAMQREAAEALDAVLQG